MQLASFIAGARAAALFGVLENAVLIDGTQFCFAHAGFQAVALHGQENRVLRVVAHVQGIGTGGEGQNEAHLKRRLLRGHCAITAFGCPRLCEQPTPAARVIEEVQAQATRSRGLPVGASRVTRGRGEESVTEGKLWTSADYDTSTAR